VLVSCPTCGRTEADVVWLAEAVEARLANIDRPIRVAVMGCVVNGPGEAKAADVGIAGGAGRGVLFVKDRPQRTMPEEELEAALLAEIERLTGEKPTD